MNDALSSAILAAINDPRPDRTLTHSGTRVRAVGGDVVTLVSENIPSAANAIWIEAAIRKFVDAWSHFAANTPGILFGVFVLPSGDYSLDVNVLRPRSARDSSLTFARWNGQHSIWDGSAEAVVPTGLASSSGSTIKTPGEARAALAGLRA